MNIENRIEFERLISEAEARSFSGWDFSWIANRWRTGDPPWSYVERVSDAISSARGLLDMGTGGGEFLASLAPLPARTYATESYAPNIPVAKARLKPLGVRVVRVEDHGRLPFEDRQFDVVINRHEEFVAAEIARIMKPSGRFITQQVGERNNRELTDWLGGEAEEFDFTLKRACAQLATAGLEIVECQEHLADTTFDDIGAIVYYLKAVPWQVLGFTVDGYRDRLAAMHNHIQRRGGFIAKSRRCYLEAVKAQVVST